jgi:hypothetical protein
MNRKEVLASSRCRRHFRAALKRAMTECSQQQHGEFMSEEGVT